MPAFLAPLILAGLQAAPKIAASISQKGKANKTRLQDTIPAASKEQLANLRLGAATSRMPGMGAAQGRLAQNFAAGAGAATRAGGSSADALASINALNLNRQMGENQLATQGLQYQDAQKNRLNAGLAQQAAYQKADQDAYSRTKSELIGSSNRNLANAVDGIAGFGAFALQGANGQTPAPAAGFDPYALPSIGGYTPNPNPVGLGGYMLPRRSQRRGVGVY